MKNRQYSLKVLELNIDNNEEFFSFLDKNYLLFKDHLIVITGNVNAEIEHYLQSKELHYLHNVKLPVGRTKKALEEEYEMTQNGPTHEAYKQLENELQSVCVEHAMDKQVLEATIRTLEKKLHTKFTVLDTMIRSGRELNIDGDLLLLNRVNSGATIHTTGNLIITQVVEGALRCDGQFMMITVSPKANIIFNGVIVDNTLLENKLNRIELKHNEIYITPVIKKDINWEQS